MVGNFSHHPGRSAGNDDDDDMLLPVNMLAKTYGALL
jgi:hypothetical protein